MKPERILLNGTVRTQDKNRPLAGAVAIANDRILAVGESHEIKSLAGSGTEILDLKGRLVLPGFMDSHLHYYDWAMGRRNLDLADVGSFAEFQDRLAEASRNAPAEAWILGQGWNESDWPENRMPTRDDLDALDPMHPVILWRCDLHLAVANSLALQLAGIDEHTPDPPHGVIARDASGRPTGILREHAPNLIKEVVSDPGDAIVFDAMLDGIPELHSYGMTGLCDVRLMGGIEGPPAMRSWQRIHDQGKLDLRCWTGIPGERMDEAISLGLRTGFGDERLRLGHVKFFMDGGMGARTAWMIEPYLDAEQGMALWNLEELRDAVFRCDRAGLAVMIHAIGDRANREVISLFENLETAHPKGPEWEAIQPSVRHRIEHLQMIRPEDIQRMAHLDLTACVQPHNMILDIRMIETSVGGLGRYAYTYRSMLDAGLPLVMSSDSPVCDPRPLVGIQAAVTRRRPDGTPEGGWYPEQALTVDEAVRAYTLSAAEANGADGSLGSITPGKHADLIVLDRDIYEIDPLEIAETPVVMTLFDGRVVHRR